MFEKQLKILLQKALNQHVDQIVLDTGSSCYSYKDLSSAVEQLAFRLRSYKIRPAQAIIVRLDSGIEFLTAMLTAIELELVFVPLSSRASNERVLELSSRLDCAVLIEHQSLHDRQIKISTLNNFLNGDQSNSDQHYNEFITAGAGFVRYTSGTTSKAKGVFVSSKTALARFQIAHDLGLLAGVRTLWPLEMSLHFVSTLPLLLMTGATIVLPNGQGPKDLERTIIEREVKQIYASPLHYQFLKGIKPNTKHQLQKAYSSTAALARETAVLFQEQWGVKIEQVYGIFEVGLVAVEKGRFFKALNGVDIQIRDEKGALSNNFEPGRIFVRSEGLLDRYLDPGKGRLEILKDGFFETGDIGRLNTDCELEILGRAISVINVGGAKVFPEEVEAVLMRAPEVLQCRAFGESHQELGQVVHAEVVLDNGCRLDQFKLRQLCRSSLERYAVPQQITAVSSLPLSEGGKVKRKVPEKPC